MTLWVNGRLVDDAAEVVRGDDHGIIVGDGVFETCEVTDGVVFARTRHLARLRRSAAGLGLHYDEAALAAGVDAVLDPAVPRARLRITVTGGPSPYGSGRGTGPATLLVATSPLPEWPATTDVAIVPWTRNEQAATAGLKTTSYADNVVALAYAHDHGADEAVFPNTRGELCEGTGSNIFVAVDGVLVTPPLTSGCLAGITRELLLEWVDGIEERPLAVDQLREADEAFISSTTRSVQPIRAVIGSPPLPGAPGPLTRHAAEVFAQRSTDEVDP